MLFSVNEIKENIETLDNTELQNLNTILKNEIENLKT
jgi:hypothetical protein